jgi:hypothetical protein
VTQYDPETGDGGLFVEYILARSWNSPEASGYPNWVQCPEDEDLYISEFHKCQVILLDMESIGPNPAKRGLAKLCLNPMWSKLTERNNRTRTKMITTRKNYTDFSQRLASK